MPKKDRRRKEKTAAVKGVFYQGGSTVSKQQGARGVTAKQKNRQTAHGPPGSRSKPVETPPEGLMEAEIPQAGGELGRMARSGTCCAGAGCAKL
jgi:hypothetical protein